MHYVLHQERRSLADGQVSQELGVGRRLVIVIVAVVLMVDVEDTVVVGSGSDLEALELLHVSELPTASFRNVHLLTLCTVLVKKTVEVPAVTVEVESSVVFLRVLVLSVSISVSSSNVVENPRVVIVSVTIA
jgi:hypothetical protein